MSIILKGIDLPEDCIAVEFKYYILKFNGYTIYDQAVTVIFTTEALNNIIQIPKGHGRLKDFDEDGIHPIIVDGVYMVKVDDLDAMPTILGWEE